MDWTRILADITGSVDQELLLRNEYLAAENSIRRAQIKGRLLLSDGEKKSLANIGARLGRKALEDVANTARPDTILRWYRELSARKFDGSKARRYPGRQRIDPNIEELVVRLATENAGITPNPNEVWMKQIARNVAMDEWGFLESRRYLIHDRDTMFTKSFREIIKSGQVVPLKLPARSPYLNAHAERWVRSVKRKRCRS